MDAIDTAVVRRLLVLDGIVQGVGMRSWLLARARDLGLGGSVRNEAGAVRIEVEGPADAVAMLRELLLSRPPPAARIEGCLVSELPAIGSTVFRIDDSHDVGGPPQIGPDTVTCADCRRELFDSGDRRYRHPFISCNACGPRWSIVTSLPYDRATTSMASFGLCARCSAEYRDPDDRRCHHQALCCPDCGPQLVLRDAAGRERAQRAVALSGAVATLLAGGTLALQGLGGFQLLCLADDPEAAARLRRRTQRPCKPCAVMVADLAMARCCADLAPGEAALLDDPSGPIVLCRAHGESALTRSVAPGLDEIGLLLPTTPVHHLLLAAIEGPLVCISGNRRGEPICIDAATAVQELAGIADAFLVHDRAILRRADDSIQRMLAGERQVLRRGRGLVPDRLRLMHRLAESHLASGAQQELAPALGLEDRVQLGTHPGDAGNLACERALLEQIAQLAAVAAAPQRLVHDDHPDDDTTRLAQEGGLPRVAVQHHLAHLLAVLAEHGRDVVAPVLGICWDGNGLSRDGGICGGEGLLLRDARVWRVAHLRPFALAGGAAAVREPWRVAWSLLHTVDGAAAEDFTTSLAAGPVATTDLPLLGGALDAGLATPACGSVGRLLDACAALLGICPVNRFDGEAALRGEVAARSAWPQPPYAMPLLEDRPWSWDWRPLITALWAERCAGVPVPLISARVHATLVTAITTLAERCAMPCVALVGDCFLNRLLAEESHTRLQEAGMEVLLARRLPPDDGGLVGQLLAVAGAVEWATEDG